MYIIVYSNNIYIYIYDISIIIIVIIIIIIIIMVRSLRPLGTACRSRSVRLGYVRELGYVGLHSVRLHKVTLG